MKFTCEVTGVSLGQRSVPPENKIAKFLNVTVSPLEGQLCGPFTFQTDYANGPQYVAGASVVIEVG